MMSLVIERVVGSPSLFIGDWWRMHLLYWIEGLVSQLSATRYNILRQWEGFKKDLRTRFFSSGQEYPEEVLRYNPRLWTFMNTNIFSLVTWKQIWFLWVGSSHTPTKANIFPWLHKYPRSTVNLMVWSRWISQNYQNDIRWRGCINGRKSTLLEEN